MLGGLHFHGQRSQILFLESGGSHSPECKHLGGASHFDLWTSLPYSAQMFQVHSLHLGSCWVGFTEFIIYIYNFFRFITAAEAGLQPKTR